MTTTLTLEQRKKLIEWMADRSVDTDIKSQERTYRKKLLDELDETHVQQMASKENIVLSDEHLGVIECLRDYFLEFGEAEKGRDLVQKYCAADCHQTYQVFKKQQSVIDELNLRTVYQLESELLTVLLRMRKNGVRFNLDKL